MKTYNFGGRKTATLVEEKVIGETDAHWQIDHESALRDYLVSLEKEGEL